MGTPPTGPRGPMAPGSGAYSEPARAPLGGGFAGAPGGGGGFGGGSAGPMRPAAALSPRAGGPGPGPGGPGGGGAPANEGWSEHTAPDGRKYYYNSVTRVSAWVKPEPLMTPEERARAAAAKLAPPPAAASSTAPQHQPPPAAARAPAPAAPAASSTAAAAAPAGGPDAAAVAAAWKEHTAPDGRKYFHNRLTRESRWQMPDEMKAAAARAHLGSPPADGAGRGGRSPPRGAASPSPAQSARSQPFQPSPQQPPQQPKPQPIPVYATKEEARDAFKELLASAGVSGDDTWEAALRRLVGDPRYNALPAIGERKTIFNEYVQARRNEERDVARRRAAEAKEAFSLMLEECGVLRPGDSYRTAKALLGDDPRWGAVPNEPAREELYDSYMRAFRSRAEERERTERREREGAFREALRGLGLKAGTPWRKAAVKLEDEPGCQGLDKADRLRLFQEHMLALEEEERAARDRARDDERRAERRRRDVFRAMLREHMAEGRIGPKTRWRDYGPTVEGEPAYAELTRNKGGSRPKELFMDIVEELEEEYDGAKAAFKDALKAAGWAASQDSSWQEFLERLEAGAAAVEQAGGTGLQGARDSFRRVYYEEAVGGARLKAEEAERRRRRSRDAFGSFLRHARGLYADTPWGEFEGAFKDEPEFKEVGEEVAKEMFDEFVEKLKRKESRDDSGGGGGKHKKRRSSRHDREDDERRGHKAAKRHRRSRSRSRGRSRSRSGERSRSRGRDKPRRETRDSDGGGAHPAPVLGGGGGGAAAARRSPRDDEAEEGEV
ncbi:MAG: hypothetical protein J3K34DRAFT_527752 [Monoraphidium minutum]|nr:MAG: hypothetical protein J3K34DRAFT_527752 [Monoraphidium minutum]